MTIYTSKLLGLAGPLTLLAALCMYAHEMAVVRAADVPRGITVILGNTCGRDGIGDDRTVVLQIQSGGRTQIDAETFPDRDIPSLMWKIMQSRNERVLRVVVDDDVKYGRFVVSIAEIKQAVPGLAVMMLRQGKPEEVMERWCFPLGVDLPPRY